MPTFSPQDVISPLVHQLALVAQQISGIGRVYETEPDNPPEDGSVLFPLVSFESPDDTNGKFYIKLTFNVMYCKRRSRGTQDIPAIYQYVLPFLQAYSAWANQSLNDEAISVTVKKGGVTQFTHGTQVFRALLTTVEVLTEFNITLS